MQSRRNPSLEQVLVSHPLDVRDFHLKIRCKQCRRDVGKGLTYDTLFDFEKYDEMIAAAKQRWTQHKNMKHQDMCGLNFDSDCEIVWYHWGSDCTGVRIRSGWLFFLKKIKGIDVEDVKPDSFDEQIVKSEEEDEETWECAHCSVKLAALTPLTEETLPDGGTLWFCSHCATYAPRVMTQGTPKALPAKAREYLESNKSSSSSSSSTAIPPPPTAPLALLNKPFKKPPPPRPPAPMPHPQKKVARSLNHPRPFPRKF